MNPTLSQEFYLFCEQEQLQKHATLDKNPYCVYGTLKNLVQNRPDEVDKYISSLHCRIVQKYLFSIRREDVFKEIFDILRQRYLSKFPVPKAPINPPPRLHIVGYTSTLADIIPLRA